MGRRIKNHTVLKSIEETFAFGVSLGKQAKTGDIFCLFGSLGAGKTTLVKAISFGAANYDPDQVNSPTFSYLNIYDAIPYKIFHFDLYRLKNENDFLALGFQEYFFLNGITLIEWSERILPLLKDLNVIKLDLKILGNNERQVEVSYGAS